MNKLIRNGVAGAVAVLAVSSAVAIPLPPTAITLTGVPSVDNNDLALANNVKPSPLTALSIEAASRVGALALVNPADPITFGGVASLNAPGVGTYPLWTFFDLGLGGPVTLTAEKSTIVHTHTTVGVQSLQIFGQGILSVPGFEDAPSDWVITITRGFTSLGISHTAQAAGVPDGGTALGMLGAAFLGLAVLRRK